MNALQPVVSRSAYGNTSVRAVASVSPARRVQDDPRQAQSAETMTVPAGQHLQGQVALLRGQPAAERTAPLHSRSAINAYRSMTADSERDRLSSLIGIDTYA